MLQRQKEQTLLRQRLQAEEKVHRPVNLQQVTRKTPHFEAQLKIASEQLNTWGFDLFCVELEEQT